MVILPAIDWSLTVCLDLVLANVFCLGAVGKMDLLTVGLLTDSFV
jgi:hypothetical protein